jgi:ABC-type dipeptide/oligopeptide/nickel transport system permease subunit/outer membrane protein assembly factor BamB
MTARAIPSVRAQPSSALNINWALWLGALLVLAFVTLALVGPSLAPRDPLQELFAVVVPAAEPGGSQRVVKPPLAPGVAADFPLGADEFGRDILSQLLWAVRPTLTLIVTVAALRLAIGLAVGLMAGWSGGALGRALDGLISLAVSLPTLFVALLLIAAAGRALGVQAFILGLALTGWAETARLVSEQTRLVKSQRYIESAQALGAGDWQIIGRHVLPHLLPLAWILLALETSSALLTTAALGFLGYFTSSVWIPLGDYSGIRAAGYPDLGQLLRFQPVGGQPWSSLMAGALIALMILGFNLLGTGLREALSPERRRRTNRWLRPVAALNGWLEERFFMTEWRRVLPLAGAAAVFAALIFGGGAWLYAQTVRADALSRAIQIPGRHLWASAQRDAQGTLWSPAPGPANPGLAWTFSDESALSGPVIAADGTLYVVTAKDGGTLAALASDGALLWQTPLPFPVAVLDFVQSGPAESGPSVETRSLAAPALNARGDVIVAGDGGALAIFDKTGRLITQTAPPTRSLLLTSPQVGAADDIYLATIDNLLIFNSDGLLRLRAPLPSYSYVVPKLRVSVDGRFVHMQHVAINPRTGNPAFTANNSIDLFTLGVDGKTYVQTQTSLDEWALSEDGTRVIVTPRIRLDARSLNLGFRPPADAGVLPDGRSWIWFLAFTGTPKLVWTELGGSISTQIDPPLGDSRLLAFDRDANAYACGFSFTSPNQFAQADVDAGVLCQAWRADGARLWELPIPAKLAGDALRRPLVSGGALAAGALYVSLGDGVLYALSDSTAPR